MLNIHRSAADTQNVRFRERPRSTGEDNVAWLARQDGYEGRVRLVLLGGRRGVAFRLRIAQSHARHDLTPSHWSHVAILGPAQRSPERTVTHEIALEPSGGFGFPTPRNGVQQGTVEAYRSVSDYPNIALLALPTSVSYEAVTAALDRFATQRNVVDALENVLTWLAFAWGVGKTGNPLLNGVGVPSAVLVEHVIGACGFELTPGLASRSSCPEAIWQSAKWWFDHTPDPDDADTAIEGAFTVEHDLDAPAPAGRAALDASSRSS